ncbi:MAG TPA: FtsX-like permease family protein [Vicinamibacteria bacterium]|nr:FtsX-like permease family protein [Vicinamibacteria bacterium]
MTAFRFVLAMAVREGRASWVRLGLLLSAVAVGVAALVAINSFTANLLDSIGAQARALLGADLALSSATPLSAKAEALLQELRHAAAVGPAGQDDSRLARVTSFAAMAYAPKSGVARLVQVAAVEPGYPFYGAMETVPQGEWGRLQEGGILGDVSFLSSTGAAVGDTVVLGEARFVIVGTVTSIPGDVSVRSAFGPRAFIAASRVEATKLLAFGSRARYEVFLRLPERAPAQRLAERFRPSLSAERVSLRTVEDDQARLTDTLGRLGRFLGLVALVALLLGGLGVASAVHVFVKRKMETIAVLRCLGASGSRVMAVYLVQALGLGLLGSLVGAGLGVSVQALLPRVLRDLLPVDVVLAPSWPAIATGVGVGVWATLVFSLLPLLGISSVSPLAVLRRPFEATNPMGRDPWRIGAALALVASVVGLAVLQAGRLGPGLAFASGIGAALLVLWLGALALVRSLRRYFPSRLPYLARQGLANLYRPANQTVTVVLALGFGAFLLGSLVMIQNNLLRELRVDGDAARPNLAFFDIQPDQRAAVAAAITAAGAQPQAPTPIVPMRIESVKGVPTKALLAAPGDAAKVRDRWALRREFRSSYRDAAKRTERVVKGTFGKAGRDPASAAGPVSVSLEVGLAREIGVDVGDEIVWDVQGLSLPSRVTSLREVDWGRFEANFFAVFPEGPLDDAPQTYVVLSRLDGAAERGLLQRRLAETLPNVTSLDLSQVQQALEALVDRVAQAIRFMAFFTLAAGAVVLIGAVGASRYQRVREGVLLRALGATRGQIRRVLFAEYAALGLLAAALGTSLAAVGGWALVRFTFDTRFVLPALPLAGLGLGVVALTLLVGLWGSADVYRRTPVEVLRAD